MTIDLDRLSQSLSDPNRLVVVIKAHLWVERAVNACLDARLENPEAMSLERMPFQQKANLIEALGIIRPPWTATIKRLNIVRNHAAHRLDWELDDEQTRSIIEQIAPGQYVDENEPLSQRFVRALTQLVGFMEGKVIATLYLAEHADAVAAQRHLRRHYEALGHTKPEALEHAVKLAPLPSLPLWEEIKERKEMQGFEGISE